MARLRSKLAWIRPQRRQDRPPRLPNLWGSLIQWFVSAERFGGGGPSVAEPGESALSEQKQYFVYLIESVPVGVYKIGYDRDLEKRRRELERRGALGAARCRYGLSWTDEVQPWQSEACKPYRLLWSAPADDYRAAERPLHKHFAEKRIKIESWPKCEWFTLDATDFDYICSIKRFECGTVILQEGHER
jgi:hypothetical protein